MRTVLLGLLVLAFTRSATTFPQSGIETAPQETVSAILHNMRDALGGQSALESVRSLKGTGRCDRIVGPVRLAGDVELRLARPDRYVRIDRILLGQLSAEIATGFNGQALIQRARGPDGRRIDPAASLSSDTAASLERSTLASLRQDASLLWLGFLGTAFDARPLTFSNAGVADSPEGRAYVVELATEDDLKARLFVDARTHLPLFVQWAAPDVLAAARAVSEPRAGVGPPIDLSLLEAAEHRMYFADYRSVGAVRWPFRLRHSVAGQVTEELVFDRFVVNPADGDAFDPSR